MDEFFSEETTQMQPVWEPPTQSVVISEPDPDRTKYDMTLKTRAPGYKTRGIALGKKIIVALFVFDVGLAAWAIYALSQHTVPYGVTVGDPDDSTPSTLIGVTSSSSSSIVSPTTTVVVTTIRPKTTTVTFAATTQAPKVTVCRP